MFQYPSRKQWEAKGPNHIVPRPEVAGGCTIYNPTIDRIKRGMLISAYIGPRSSKFDDSRIVEATNAETGKASVRCCIGGTRECIKTIPVERVHCVWDVGGYDAVLYKLDGRIPGTCPCCGAKLDDDGSYACSFVYKPGQLCPIAEVATAHDLEATTPFGIVCDFIEDRGLPSPIK